MKNSYKDLFLFLGIAFGVSWLIGLLFLFLPGVMASATGGGLGQQNPIMILVLYLPSIAGLITCTVMGGFKALKAMLYKFIPRKQDLFWFPLLLGVFILFDLFMHYCSVLFGIPVPKITATVPQIIVKAIGNIVAEVGLIGGIFGWMGFLLPYLQGKLKNNVTAAVLTAIVFGLWVLPGYLVASFQQTTAFILYLGEIMLFFMFVGYIFNATKGNLLFYMYTFWLTATGSHIQLYYWNEYVQMMQIAFFSAAVMVMYYLFDVKKIKKADYSLQIYPDYLQENEEYKIKESVTYT